MSILSRPLSSILLALTVAGCTSYDDHLVVDAPRAQFFTGMGERTWPITTSSPDARRFFDQGIAWMYAFNHDEAIRSFAGAAAQDPKAAMPWWGIALCEGPNYNDPVMTAERSSAAWAALQHARARIADTTPLERDLIEALEHRYADPWPEDRGGLDRAYADAMATVWAAHPSDSDIGTLYAESLMVLRPWMLYTPDQVPEEETPTIVATLERVLAMDPRNPGANHLYIHAIEPSADPGKAGAAADRLRDQVPGAGHLNHMPSHIYVQTGEWDKSIEANAKAMKADDRYRALSPDQGIQHMYMVHNAHMLAYSAMMVGREKEAMEAARAMWTGVPDDTLESVAPFLDLWMTSVYDVQKRFGRWDAILAEPAPPSFLPITRAVWRAHRAIAYAAKKDIPAAEREYRLFKVAKDAIPDENVFGGDSTHQILEVSDHFIAGEIALQQEDWAAAAEHLQKAVDAEDLLSYGEPPQWLQPTRHTLGAVYLKAGRHQDAEQVYRQDLAKWPNNGWSLFGLSRALDEQGRREEAAQFRRRYQEVWAKAESPTFTSCKCLPEA